MKNIQIFDPALCCSTGVCGTNPDQTLINFSADVEAVKKQGAKIERFNLAQEPLVFAQNSVVKSFLERSGQEALPLVLIDNEIVLAGRYPTKAELLKWAGIQNDTCCDDTCCAEGEKCCDDSCCTEDENIANNQKCC